MQKTKGFIKRMMSWVLAFVMVCSVVAGVMVSSPSQIIEAAEEVSKITTPITEYAADTETTVWKVLWVLPLTSTYIIDSVHLQGDTVTNEEVQQFIEYIVPNVEAAIYEYSAHYMKLESTVITIDTLDLARSYQGLMPTAEVVKVAIESGEGINTITGTLLDLTAYDHIVSCFQPENTSDAAQSLGFSYDSVSGGRFRDLKSGYSVISFAKGMGVDDTNKSYKTDGFVNEDGTVNYYFCAKKVVRSIFDSLASYVYDCYPLEWMREMPFSTESNRFYTVTSDFDLMNEFYRDFFRGAVPTAKGSKNTWGMTVQDYKRPPSLYHAEPIGVVEIGTLEEWNEICFAIAMGAYDSETVIKLIDNIDARGKKIYTIPEFSGALNGCGYAITGATFSDGGLIGTLEEGGWVRDLLLLDAAMINKACSEVGLLVDYNYGEIFMCGVTGTLTGKDYCAGIAGISEQPGKIYQCFNGATITSVGNGSTAAGIVADCANDLYCCFNYGMILSTGKSATTLGIGNFDYEIQGFNYTLAGTAQKTYLGGGSDKVAEVTSEVLASSELLTVNALHASGECFKEGNGYPTIKRARIDYMTTGGSTLLLADENTEADVTIWAGGIATKLTITLKATKWKNASGTTKSGAITWIIKNAPTEITFNELTHAVTTKSDTTIATVSKGTVKGKAEGKVYVYAVDTGSMTAEAFVVQVKAAPTTVATYYTPDVESDTVKYTSDIIPEGSTFRIYYKGTTGTVKKGDWKILTDEDLTYTLTVPAKYKDYITVTENTENDFFEVSVAEGAIAKFGKNKVKPFTVSLVVKNDQTGKKTTFKAVISNPVNDVTLKAGEGTTATTDKDTGMLIVTLDSAKTEQKTGMITETVNLYNLDGTRTDSTKIVRIPHPEQYGFSATSAITLVGKTSANQNKVTLAAVKGQPGQYKITAKKGTQDGTEAYFIIWHNSFERTAGKGYQIVKVVVGEANHVTDMELDMKYGAGINTGVEVTTEENTNNIMVEMPSAKTAKQTAYLTEAILLEKNGENCTDGYVVYKLPCGTEDAFTIASNGVVTVNGALTAEQKKVSMTDVKNDSEYTITAAKGTPEGTEAYLLLYHNPEQYSIISVTVGAPNRVKTSTLTKDETNKAENVVIATETLGDGTMTVITVPYSTAKQTVVVKENRTLEIEGNNTATDVNKVLRMAKADGYEVALNEASVTAKGTLSAAQKKISMAQKKKTTDVFNITVAAKTPVGTESYFIIYHNNENPVSGGSYHIVKVVVTEEKAAE